MRLGAALAAQAQAGRAAPGALVLWDPVLDGARYLEALRADHQVWMHERARVRPGSPRDPEQRLGFPLPEALRAQIAALRPGLLESRLESTTLLVETRAGDGAHARGDLDRGGGLQAIRVPGPPVWRRDEGDGMSGSLVPLETIDRIAQWLGGAAR